MPNYRRAFIPGSSVFLTLVSYNRASTFQDPENIQRLRWATAMMKADMGVEITATAILPGHIHFIWALPQDNSSYSKRGGRLLEGAIAHPPTLEGRSLAYCWYI